MASSSKDEERTKLERFDGTEPSTYKKWRRKAELMLLSLPTTYEKSRWGPKLCEYISGEAEELIEHLTISQLCNEDGYAKVLEALDEKYQKTKQMETQTYLKEYFYKSVIKQGETYRQFVVRLETVYRHLSANKITLPDEVKGWLLLKKLALDSTQEALILTAAQGSLQYADITEALFKVMPEGKCTTNPKAKEVFMMADEMAQENQFSPEEEPDTAAEVFEAVADYAQDMDGDYEDALEVFETYSEIRKRMQSQKVARGFRANVQPPLQLTGTMQARIQQLKDRTRCHICLRPGHWKRKCPKKDKGSKGGASMKGSGKSQASKSDGHEAMVADHESLQNEVAGVSHEARELRGKFDEVFFTEDSLEQLEALVVDSAVEKGGAASVSMFSKVFEDHFGSSDRDGDEAYMCDSSNVCSLFSHAVPDTACRRTLVGEVTLKGIQDKLKEIGRRVRYVEEKNVFRFGNNECLETCWSVLIPVKFGPRPVVIKAAVLSGQGGRTPLLLSKEFLKQLGTRIDMSSSLVEFKSIGITVKMGVTSKGHYAIPLFDDVVHTYASHDTMHVDDEPKSLMETAAPSQEKVRVFSCKKSGAHHVDEQECAGQPRGGHDDKPEAGDQQEEVPGSSRQSSDVGTEPGPTTRSARRRERRRRAARREALDNRKVQGQDISRGLSSPEGVPRMDPSECVSSGAQVLDQHAGASHVHRESRHSEARQDDETDDGREVLQGKDQCDSSHRHGEQLGRSDGGRACDRGGKTSDHAHGDAAVPNSLGELGEQDPTGHGREEQDRDEVARADEDGRKVDSESEPQGETSVMTKAERKLVRRSIEKIMRDHHEVVDVLTVCDVGGQDVMEVFSTPHITAAAQRMSLKADHAFDIKVGCDLQRPEHQKQVFDLVQKKRPKLLVVCPPCGPFSTLQRLTVLKGERYYENLRQGRELLEFAMELCAHQHTHGLKFVFEHPWLAESWDEACVKKVSGMRGVQVIKMDQCMFGLRDPVSKKRYKKSTGIMTDCREIAERLSKLCDRNHEHEPILGNVKTLCGWKRRSEVAQRYPKAMVNAILAGFLEHEYNKQKEVAVSTVYAVEVFSKETDDKKIMAALRRCHENLGHPSNGRVCVMLKSAHANERTLQLAKGLTCPACDVKKQPASRPVAKEKRAWEFNQQIMVDTFEVEAIGKKLKMLNIVDEATGFQTVAPLWHGAQASNVRSCYRKYWKRWAGCPRRVLADNGKEFEAEFAQGVESDGSFLDTTAAMAPHQNGMAERRGGVWKEAFYKTVLAVSPSSKSEVEEICDQVTFAVNTLPRVDGFSPHQHVFGKEAGIPGSLELRDEKVVESSALKAGETMYVKRQEIRKAAQKAYIEAHEEDRVRRAVNHQTRPTRGPYAPGDLVYFWRMWPREKKACWHGPGTVIGYHDGNSKIWVAKGTKMYKCSPEQLRRVSQEQESLIRMLPEDLLSVRKLMHERGSGNYIDLSTREKPPVLENSHDMNEDDDDEMLQGFGGLLREREKRVKLMKEG